MVTMLVEKIKNRIPRTVREFLGFPIEYEWKQVPVEVKAIADDREMADGRPAYAWWNELQMLRQHESELQKQELRLTERMTALRIAEWAVTQELHTGDTLIRFKWSKLCLGSVVDFMDNPGGYCEIVKKENLKW